MAGIGVSFGIAIAYWTVNLLFEEIGNVNQLPPPVAAWPPDVVFALAGLYLMARMRTRAVGGQLRRRRTGWRTG